MSILQNSYRFKSLPSAILLSILAFVYSYISLPTNVGYIFWALVILTFITYNMMVEEDKTNPNNDKLTPTISFFLVFGVLLLSMVASPMVFSRIDNAKHFDELLIYTDEDELPFQTKINGQELRVVDQDMARSIMDKTNIFGSNRAIYSIHLGNYQGSLYWIGGAIFDGIILNDQNNRIVGFILVDITDPTTDPIIIEQEFEVAPNLIFNHDSQRSVWFENINYLLSYNAYFSYNDELNRMEYVVPYSIQDSSFLGHPKGGIVTSDMELDGGVLIYGSEGELIQDYRYDQREDLPAHATIQLYSEDWLEMQISRWGQSLVNDNEVRWSTVLPWVRSERLLGIDDDVRVVINPDTLEAVQYILLDSTDSTNQILRGAIKANASGLHYYNFEKYGFIDTNSAHQFANQAITAQIGTATHGYEALLPILYPIADDVQDLYDYAYVMPLQLSQTRFGGIAIINPSDKTGTSAIVETVSGEERANISEIVSIAVDRYVNSNYGRGSNSSADSITGEFTIDNIRSYQQEGSTIYAMNGTFVDSEGIIEFDGPIRILFSQVYITNEQEWLDVVFANPGDKLSISITQNSDGTYYTISIN